MRALVAMLVLLVGCGDGGDLGEPGASDCEGSDAACAGDGIGEVAIQAPSGKPLARYLEAQACEVVSEAAVARAFELDCSVTMRICPDLVRVHSGAACLLYDGARLEQCIGAIQGEHVCGPLVALPCEAIALESTAPAGCSGDPD